jgi:hypothetical protein
MNGLSVALPDGEAAASLALTLTKAGDARLGCRLLAVALAAQRWTPGLRTLGSLKPAVLAEIADDERMLDVITDDQLRLSITLSRN